MHWDDLNLENSYSPLKAYCQSKLANLLFTRELVKRLKGKVISGIKKNCYVHNFIIFSNYFISLSFFILEANIEGISVYSLHPGVVASELGRHLSVSLFRGSSALFSFLVGKFVKTPELGAQTSIYCAVDEEAGKQTGLYYKYKYLLIV